jgi:diaminohydroxyphosphoribosylaminopyrimidine deaminase/5-amino-6-(5-phosphoribosylamino)uracil reductase
LTGSDDIRHMRHALRLAARALGRVAPNPAVGCVIVAPDGVILGRGWTAPGGRPHAETFALAQAGAAAKGATAYVTLEPCAHYGQTPPCAEALIAAGVSRVVGAVVDPDPRVKGKGFATLAAAGIVVNEGVCEDEARALNAGFFSRIEKGRPLVALKVAESADGYAAPPPGGARWITAEPARRHAHLLRAMYDAIMVGVGTVLADDPLLTCRLAELEARSPIRIVLDAKLRTPLTSQLVQTARTIPVLLFAGPSGGEKLADAGVEIFHMASDADGRLDLAAIVRVLGERGLTRLLVEGGPALHADFLRRGLADLIYRYVSPAKLGGGLRSAIAAAELPGFTCAERERIGPDLLETFRVKG